MTSPIRCAIVDDEPLAIQVIETHLDQIPGLECVASCESALEALDVLRQQRVDLLFLDIQMPKLTGLDLVRSLERLPKVIFTTAHREYALDAFDLDVVDYLLKPISLPRLLRAVDRYRKAAAVVPGAEPAAGGAPDAEPITVRADRENVRIRPAEVILVESVGDYIKIYTTDGTVLTKETLTAFEEQLRPYGVLRVHRSYLVALSSITSYTAEEVRLGDRAVPIGRTYRQAVLTRLKD